MLEKEYDDDLRLINVGYGRGARHIMCTITDILQMGTDADVVDADTSDVTADSPFLPSSLFHFATEICARFSSVGTSAIDVKVTSTQCTEWFQFAFRHFWGNSTNVQKLESFEIQPDTPSVRDMGRRAATAVTASPYLSDTE